MGRGERFNSKRKQERRAIILGTAVKLFALNGLAATKISQIADGAGMSQGLMYHYFRSKEEIYVELIRHAFERMNTAARALEAMPASPKEKIRAAVIRLLEGFNTADTTSGYYHLLIAQATASTAIPREAAAIIERGKQGPLPGHGKNYRPGAGGRGAVLS